MATWSARRRRCWKVPSAQITMSNEPSCCGRGAHVGLDDADAGVAHRGAAVVEHHCRCVEGGHVVAVLGERDRDASEACAKFEDSGTTEAAGQLSVEIEISVDRAKIELVEGRDRFE